MERALGLGMALGMLLSGCAGVPRAPERDPVRCEWLYRDYDRATRTNSPYSTSADDDRALVLSPEYSRRANRLLAAGCVTRSAEIADLLSLREEIGWNRPADSGAAVEPVALHVGVVTSITDEVMVLQFFRSIGFGAQSQGGEGLGRRIYIGPLATEGAVADAVAVARRAGFVAPYASDVFRFGLIPPLL